MALSFVRSRVSLVGISTVVAVCAFGLATAGAANGATTNAAAALPVVKVAPSKGLVDLQKVTVTATGFSPNVQVATVECRPGALAEADCDLGTIVYAPADKHGALTVTRYVRRLITVTGKKVDCGAAKGCVLGAGNISNLEQANGVTIFFNPKVPAKVATITVSTSTGLVDHQLVTVSGKGYAPSSNVYLSQCVAHPPSGGTACDYATQRYLTVDASGTFTATNVVLERRQAVPTKTGSQIIDCAAKAGTCVMQASASGLGPSTPIKASLSFNPNVKPAVASVLLSQSTLLQDLASVTVSGTGFTPGYGVNVQECAVTKTVPAPCDYTTLRAVTAGLHGQFTLTYPVRRDIVTYIAPAGATVIDCAAASGACELTVQGTQSQPAVSLTLGFDPSAPAVTPAIAAAPNAGLSDNQSVTVSLQGFTPSQPVQVIECSAEAVEETANATANFGYCDYTTALNVTPGSAAVTQTPFTVRATIGGQGGLVDCTSQPGACVLVATENGGGGYYYGVATAASPSAVLPNVAFTALTFASP